MPTIDPSQFTALPDYGPEDQQYSCSTCGMPHRTGSNEPVFRGNWIDMEGFYTICVDCASHVGKLAGLIEPGQVDDTVAANIALEDINSALTSEIVELEKIIEAYQLLLGDVGEEE